MEVHGLTAGGLVPVFLADAVIAPAEIVFLCALAGVGLFLLLPSWRSTVSRASGGVLLAASLLILAALALGETSSASRPEVGPYFWIFSAIALVGAIRVVTHPRPVYSALYFVLSIFASAGLFILLSADFLAAALVLIYAGAILVTYVFVIMLATQASGSDGGKMGGLADYDATSREPIPAVIICFVLVAALTFLIFDRAEGLVAGSAWPQHALDQPTQALGEYLFHYQVVNLELAGLILTLAMIGAIVIARRKVIETLPTAPEELLGPATPVNDDPHSIPVVGTRDPGQKAYPQT